jgi:hypothetical protein
MGARRPKPSLAAHFLPDDGSGFPRQLLAHRLGIGRLALEVLDYCALKL